MAPSSSTAKFHRPESVDELTRQNVKAIVQLEGETEKQRSWADRAADWITRFCGSMAFVWVHVIWFTVWIVWNGCVAKPLDPYPFSFLTLVVSLEAIFLSTFILISDNRQRRIAERRSHLDLQINLLAEQENTKVLQLLEKMARKMGVDPDDDPNVAVLEQATRPDEVLRQIDESVAAAEREDARCNSEG